MPGLALLGGVAAGYDIVAIRRGWQTICGGIRQTCDKAVGRYVAGVLVTAFVFHLLHD